MSLNNGELTSYTWQFYSQGPSPLPIPSIQDSQINACAILLDHARCACIYEVHASFLFYYYEPSEVSVLHEAKEVSEEQAVALYLKWGLSVIQTVPVK